MRDKAILSLTAVIDQGNADQLNCADVTRFVMKMLSIHQFFIIYTLLFTSAIIAVTPSNYVDGARDGITVAFVGDISCNITGRATINSIMADNPDAFVILGDMSYGPSAGCFYSYVKDLKNQGVTVRCDIGNHDSEQEQSDQLEKSYWNLCAGGTSQKEFWKH